MRTRAASWWSGGAGRCGKERGRRRRSGSCCRGFDLRSGKQPFKPLPRATQMCKAPSHRCPHYRCMHTCPRCFSPSSPLLSHSPRPSFPPSQTHPFSPSKTHLTRFRICLASTHLMTHSIEKLACTDHAPRVRQRTYSPFFLPISLAMSPRSHVTRRNRDTQDTGLNLISQLVQQLIKAVLECHPFHSIQTWLLQHLCELQDLRHALWLGASLQRARP